MKIFAETDRILLREIVMDDAVAIFEMDADPEVHRYLGNSPIESMDEAVAYILFVRKQYEELGIGRWAIVDRENGEFVGWGGMKFRTDKVNGYQNYYDVGYRLLRKHWGKGYATEASKACVQHGFRDLNLNRIIAQAMLENTASIAVMKKTGMSFLEESLINGIPSCTYQILKGN